MFKLARVIQSPQSLVPKLPEALWSALENYEVRNHQEGQESEEPHHGEHGQQLARTPELDQSKVSFCFCLWSLLKPWIKQEPKKKEGNHMVKETCLLWSLNSRKKLGMVSFTGIPIWYIFSQSSRDLNPLHLWFTCAYRDFTALCFQETFFLFIYKDFALYSLVYSTNIIEGSFLSNAPHANPLLGSLSAPHSSQFPYPEVLMSYSTMWEQVPVVSCQRMYFTCTWGKPRPRGLK